MSDIETAEQFAQRVFTYVADSFIQRWRPAEAKTGALKLIEARDAAIRLALLESLLSVATPVFGVPVVSAAAIQVLIAKYSPTSKEASCRHEVLGNALSTCIICGKHPLKEASGG